MTSTMSELLKAAAKGTKFDGNEYELYISICGDYRARTDLSKEEKIKKISKRIFDMAMANGYRLA